MMRDVRVCNPEESIRHCAKAMADTGVGLLPVEPPPQNPRQPR